MHLGMVDEAMDQFKLASSLVPQNTFEHALCLLDERSRDGTVLEVCCSLRNL